MSLWIILDLIVIGVYVISILFFKNKGFLKSSETLISLILTLCLMTTALPFFQDILDKSAIGEAIHESVESMLLPKEGETEPSEGIALPDFMQEAVDDKLTALDTAKDNMISATADYTADLVIRVISTILLFLLIKIGIFLLFRILGVFFKLAPLNFVNRTLGVVLGVLNATVIVYVLCAVAVIVVPVEYSAILKSAISDTFLTQIFYNDNILLKLFM